MTDANEMDALDALVDALAAGADPDELARAHPALAEEIALVASLQRAADSVALDAAEEASFDGAEDATGEADDDPRDGAAVSVPHLLAPGTRLGECVLEDLLGAGGMGEVYLARDEVLGREVAVKVLRPSLADDPESVSRFRRELKAQASLSAHPNVVTALHASEADGRLYLVMEHVEGTDLRRLVRGEGPVAPARAARLIAQAARGLAHAHAHGIIHRDIKPSNLLVTARGEVKLSDLGLASLSRRDAGEAEAERAWVDELIGSLDYMAPEQAKDPDAATEKSDLYALGCTLYFLLEGRAPFADRLALKKLMAHAVEPPPPLSRDVPQRLREVLASLLAKDPSERPTSAEAVAAQLGELTPASEPTRETTAPPARGPGPWRAIAAALGLIAAGAIGVAAWLGTRADDPTARLVQHGAVRGRLDVGDRSGDKSGVRLETYVVPVEAGRTYAWTLRSLELDPTLTLSARTDEGAWELARNDDAPGLGRAAQIVWTADRTGDVELTVSGVRRSAAGDYLLTMEELRRRELRLGETVRGRLESGDARLYSDDSLVDYYWLPVRAGETYVLEAEGEGYTPFVFLETADRRPFGTSQPIGGEVDRVQLTYVSTEAGALFVGMGTVPQDGHGDYTLRVTTELVGELTLSVNGTLEEGDALLRDNTLADYHTFAATSGHTYVITMHSDDFDTFLLLESGGGLRVATNDDALQTDSRIVYRAERDDEMRVIANAFRPGMAGAYRLTVLDVAP